VTFAGLGSRPPEMSDQRGVLTNFGVSVFMRGL
jgi:hypothetical protein